MAEKRTGFPIEQFGSESKRWGMPADTPEAIEAQHQAELEALRAADGSDETNEDNNSTEGRE